LRAAYEAVVKEVVCANGGGKGVVCGWWGEEGGGRSRTREERRREESAPVNEVGEAKRGLVITNMIKTSVIGIGRQRWNMMRGAVRKRNTTRVTKYRKVGKREEAKGEGDRRGGVFVF
jgi:hypothetical protein